MTKRVYWGYWGCIGVLAVMLVAVPASRPLVLTTYVLVSTAGVVVGVIRNRPRRTVPWLLWGFGIFAFGAGSITAAVLDAMHETAFPSVADVIFLGLCFPGQVLGLATLTRSGAAVRDRASFLDALILTVGAGFLSWMFLIMPYLNNPHLTGMEKGISIAYPLGDILLLSILSRIAVGGVRNTSVRLLMASGAGLLAADTLYGLSQLNGDFQAGGWADVGWLLFYAFGGASALHSSMTGLTEPKVLRAARSGTRRTAAGIAVLGTASFVAPAVLLGEALHGPVYHGVIIACVSAALTLLTAARVGTISANLRRGVARERELRLACEALLSTTSLDAVHTAVQTAITRLLPKHTPHRVVLTIVEPSADEVDEDAAAATGMAMRYRSELPDPVAKQFAGFELALHCPLTVAGRSIGELYVAAAEVPLISLQDAAPVLGGQAASIVRTIFLNQEVNRRGVEEALLRRAYLDPLTGLGNRPAFQEAVARAVESAGRSGIPAAVVVLDVDDFKMVNDSMGPIVGDQLLVAISQRLVASVEPVQGIVARLAGDEFGIVLGAVHPAGFASEASRGAVPLEDVLERLSAAFAEPFSVSESIVTAQISIGVATTETAAESHQLQGQADVALGAAKAAGKGRWRRYEASLHEQVLERRQLRTDLDQALATSTLQVYFQPIVDLGTGATRGLEALARWPHPTRGMVPPDKFIGIAEESGLIVPLGAWVLRTSIAAAARWRTLFPANPPYVSVNVSVRQFRTPNFVNHVLDELRKAGLPPELLTLEITESLLLGDDEQIVFDLAALREAGVKISIDDFGTGYSSLSYLHRVAVDNLKLDKSFVDALGTSQRQLELVHGIIQLARTLRIDVVAEGIETPADHRLLIDAQCDLGQGYLFARPMPPAEADTFLRRQTSEPVPS
jgi:diguanylate cyclase (GGDEF)-like protein